MKCTDTPQQAVESSVSHFPEVPALFSSILYYVLYNNQINARAVIGQSAVDYCACKPTEKSRVF